MDKETLNQQKPADMQALYDAINGNHVDEAKRIIDLDMVRRRVGAEPLCDDAIASNGKRVPVMCMAAENGSLEIVDYLIKSGARLDLTDDDNYFGSYSSGTPLIRAARNAHVLVIKRLIKAGASINHVHTTHHRSMSALSVAVEQGHENVVKQLIAHGANYDHECLEQAFDSAIARGYLPVITFLFQVGALDNYVKKQAKDKLNNTIMACVRYEVWRNDNVICRITPNGMMSKDMACFLMDNGFSDKNAWIAALHSNRESGDDLMTKVSIILSSLRDRQLYSDSFEDKQQLSQLLLIYTLQKSLTYSLVNFLLNNGANINHQDCDGKTALMLTRAQIHCNILLDKGAHVDLRDSQGFTALHHHASKGSAAIPIMQELLNHKACVDARDHEGKTPLMIASSSILEAQPRVINRLLNYGASIDHRDNQGRTALFLAVHTMLTATGVRSFNSVKTLLDSKANPCITDHTGLSIMAIIQRAPSRRILAKETITTWLSTAMESYIFYPTLYQHPSYPFYANVVSPNPTHKKQFVECTNITLHQDTRIFDTSDALLSHACCATRSIYQNQYNNDWSDTACHPNDSVFTVTLKQWSMIKAQQDKPASSHSSASSAASTTAWITVYQHHNECYWLLQLPDSNRHEFRKAEFRRNIWDLISDQVDLRTTQKRKIVSCHNRRVSACH